VHVPGAKWCCVEGVGAQDLTVSRDDEGVVSGDLVGNLPNAGRLAQREICRDGELGHGGPGESSSPAAPAVWLGDHKPYLVP
jgi:hypothetical protein